VDGIILQTVLC